MHLSYSNLLISLQLLLSTTLSSMVVTATVNDQDPLVPEKEVKGTQVGDAYPITISSNHDKSDLKPLSSDDGMTDTYTLTYEDASYLSVHFSHFNLPSGCFLDISDDKYNQLYTLTGRGKFDLGTFWAHHVNGDTMDLTLSCDSHEDKELASFEIDEFVAGYPASNKNDVEDHLYERRHLRSRTNITNDPNKSSFIETMKQKNQRDLSICGRDDKRNAVCYKTSDPIVYTKARAVARLLMNGRGTCTGWLVSGSNLLFTNEHCIDSLSDVQNTDFEFMAEEPECGKDQSFRSGINDIYDGTALLKVSATWDYALIQLSGNPASKYGYLELDNRKASVNEEIYIPQHPGGRPKEIAVFDSNHNGNCKVMKYIRWCAPEDMIYSCDTERGSSGSPVLSRRNHKVVALHHCGSRSDVCNNGNMGAPIYKFYDEISSFFTPKLDNYDFYPYMDSRGLDIKNVPGGIEAAAAACDANSACRGFNSNGWIKHTLKPRSQWIKWTDDASKGFYVKKGSILDKYDFYPYMDSGGYDIKNVPGGIGAAAAACNANSACRGFNSNGFIKYKVKPQSQWNRWTDDVTKGFYVKK